MKQVDTGHLMPDEHAQLGWENHEEFVDAWRQWHHLSQAVVDVGKAWATPRDDDSHSTLTYWPGSGEFFCDAEASGLQSSWNFIPPVIEVTRVHTEGKGQEAARLEYDGYTLDEVRAWVHEQATRLGGPAKQKATPAPDLPDHPVAHGQPLAFAEATGDLYNHYVMTLVVLDRLADAVDPQPEDDGDEDAGPGAEPSSVQLVSLALWPHHFDLAALFVVARDEAGEPTQTIGVGITPPDDTESAGYWYVSPWSKEKLREPFVEHELPIGRWVHRDGPPMAVLPITAVWEIANDASLDDPGPVQAEALAAFIAAGFGASAAGLALGRDTGAGTHRAGTHGAGTSGAGA